LAAEVVDGTIRDSTNTMWSKVYRQVVICGLATPAAAASGGRAAGMTTSGRVNLLHSLLNKFEAEVRPSLTVTTFKDLGKVLDTRKMHTLMLQTPPDFKSCMDMLSKTVYIIALEMPQIMKDQTLIKWMDMQDHFKQDPSPNCEQHVWKIVEFLWRRHDEVQILRKREKLKQCVKVSPLLYSSCLRDACAEGDSVCETRRCRVTGSRSSGISLREDPPRCF